MIWVVVLPLLCSREATVNSNFNERTHPRRYLRRIGRASGSSAVFRTTPWTSASISWRYARRLRWCVIWYRIQIARIWHCERIRCNAFPKVKLSSEEDHWTQHCSWWTLDTRAFHSSTTTHENTKQNMHTCTPVPHLLTWLCEHVSLMTWFFEPASCQAARIRRHKEWRILWRNLIRCHVQKIVGSKRFRWRFCLAKLCSS